MAAEHPLVENMARAMARENGDEFDAVPGKPDRARHAGRWMDGVPRDYNAPTQADYLDMARAALKVVAEWEPSEGMMHAGLMEMEYESPVPGYAAMMSALKRESGL